MTVRLSTLGPQGPFSIKICERLLLSYTAWCLPTCLVRRWSYKGAQQLPSCHGYARPGGEISTQNAANFGLGRPQWAEARRTQGLVFGAAGRKCLSSRRASPRKWGPGQAAYERPLREGAHRRWPPTHLWLLSGRTESNTRPPAHRVRLYAFSPNSTWDTL